MALIGSGPEEDVMSTINITPFTDVLLVLLIIFMILTSLLKPPPVPETFKTKCDAAVGQHAPLPATDRSLRCLVSALVRDAD